MVGIGGENNGVTEVLQQSSVATLSGGESRSECFQLGVIDLELGKGARLDDGLPCTRNGSYVGPSNSSLFIEKIVSNVVVKLQR